LKIASDGGIKELKGKHGSERQSKLWRPSRYLSAVVLLCFAFCNVYYILLIDVTAVLERRSERYTEFLLGTFILSKFGIEEHQPQKMIYAVELIILHWLLAYVAMDALSIICLRGEQHEMSRWRASCRLCWRTLPDMSDYSALRLLRFATPAVLKYDLGAAVSDIKLSLDKGDVLWQKQSLLLMFFLILRAPVCFVIGFDCFLIKARVMVRLFTLSSEATAAAVFGAVIILNQILGAVQLQRTVQNQLYRFVFAGEDGTLSRQEFVRQNVWEAMVARTMYKEFSWLQATTLMLSWSDEDFQMMILDQEEISSRKNPDVAGMPTYEEIGEEQPAGLAEAVAAA
jgi:hypothetical protein